MRRIDADALGDKVADLYSEGEEATEADKVVNDVIDLIDNAPTIELTDLQDAFDQGYACGWKERYGEPSNEERPQGEWIVTERGYECSKCGALHVDDYPFCHMCGVYMTKEEENDGY